jgi:hypothetical protein
LVFDLFDWNFTLSSASHVRPKDNKTGVNSPHLPVCILS